MVYGPQPHSRVEDEPTGSYTRRFGASDPHGNSTVGSKRDTGLTQVSLAAIATAGGVLPASTTRDVFTLSLSPFAYRVAWILVVFFHTLQATLIARALYSLERTLRFPLLVTNVLAATGVKFHTSIVYLSIVGGSCVICVNVCEISRLILASLRAGKLTLRNIKLLTAAGSSSASASSWSRVKIFVHRMRWWCSTRGPYFELAYHTREAVEVAMQTAQAYRLSYVVAHDWANQLATAVIVLNCWSSPLMYWVCSRDAVKRRLSCLAVDVLLDFTSSLVVPYTIYAKYRSMLPAIDMFDPVWVHQVSNDVQQFTNTSLFDVLFRTAAAASMIMSLQTIQALLRRRPKQASRRVLSPSGPQTSLVPMARASSRRQSKPSPHRKWLPVVHFVFVAFGFAVLAVFGSASLRQADRANLQGCQLAMRQWFAKKYRCAVLEINCHAREIRGASEELSRVLDQVDKQSLSSLVVSHCRDVFIPATILRFRNLAWLEIYNSTLSGWPGTATPRQTTNPHLSRVLLIHVNISTQSLPDGLVPGRHGAFPTMLAQFVFVDTNLAALPHDLSSRWSPSHVKSILMEDCALPEIPPQLKDFSPTTFSVAYNHIAELPEWIFDRSEPYSMVSFAGNPLGEIPSNISTSATPFARLVTARPNFKGVFFDMTNLSTLPTWAMDAGICSSVDVFAFGSPLCDGFLNTRSSCSAPATHCARPADPVPAREIGRIFPLRRHDLRRRPDS